MNELNTQPNQDQKRGPMFKAGVRLGRIGSKFGWTPGHSAEAPQSQPAASSTLEASKTASPDMVVPQNDTLNALVNEIKADNSSTPLDTDSKTQQIAQEWAQLDSKAKSDPIANQRLRKLRAQVSLLSQEQQAQINRLVQEQRQPTEDASPDINKSQDHTPPAEVFQSDENPFNGNGDFTPSQTERPLADNNDQNTEKIANTIAALLKSNSKDDRDKAQALIHRANELFPERKQLLVKMIEQTLNNSHTTNNETPTTAALQPEGENTMTESTPNQEESNMDRTIGQPPEALNPQATSSAELPMQPQETLSDPDFLAEIGEQDIEGDMGVLDEVMAAHGQETRQLTEAAEAAGDAAVEAVEHFQDAQDALEDHLDDSPEMIVLDAIDQEEAQAQPNQERLTRLQRLSQAFNNFAEKGAQARARGGQDVREPMGRMRERYAQKASEKNENARQNMQRARRHGVGIRRGFSSIIEGLVLAAKGAAEAAIVQPAGMVWQGGRAAYEGGSAMANRAIGQAERIPNALVTTGLAAEGAALTAGGKIAAGAVRRVMNNPDVQQAIANEQNAKIAEQNAMIESMKQQMQEMMRMMQEMKDQNS